jgi:hypothetical protein
VENAGFLALLDKGVYGREGCSRKLAFESPHGIALLNKILYKLQKQAMSHDMLIRLSEQTLLPQISLEL